MGQLRTDGLKLRRNKLIMAITGCLILLLVIGAGILWSLQLLRQIFGGTNAQAYPTIYITQHREAAGQGGVLYGSPTSTLLYAVNGQNGKIQQTIALPDSDTTYYQKSSNGRNYELMGTKGGTALLVATDLRTGLLVWEDTFAQPFSSVLASATTLYLSTTSGGSSPETFLVAISLQDGAHLWERVLGPAQRLMLVDQRIFVQEQMAETILALSASDGHQLWMSEQIGSAVPDAANLAVLEPGIVDNGHIFFSYTDYDRHARTSTGTSALPRGSVLLFELDERTGRLLGQSKLALTGFASFAVQDHRLLLQTGDMAGAEHLIVLDETNMSEIWSATLQSSYDLGRDNYWILAGESIYGFSAVLNPETYLVQPIMTAWQIATGQQLFKTMLDLSGAFNVYRENDQILLTSIDNPQEEGLFGPEAQMPLVNDVEARQAQTGRLLWHRHVGRLPLFNKGILWALSVVETNDTACNRGVCQYQNNVQDASVDTLSSYQPVTDLYSNDDGKTTLYLSGGGAGSQVVYVALQAKTADSLPGSMMLDALDKQTGALLWQVVPAELSVPTMPAVTFFPLPIPTDMPGALTAGPDGNLWFTVFPAAQSSVEPSSQIGKIGRITPLGQITTFALPQAGMVPRALTAGPDGNLWFVENLGDRMGAIGRITPLGQIIEFPLPAKRGVQGDTNSMPMDITAGPDGNLWFTENGGNAIGRITPLGQITTFALPAATADPTQIVAGPGGDLWFLDKSAQGYSAIASITPDGIIKEYFFNSTLYNPISIVAGLDGNLWYVDGSNQAIGYMAPDGSGYLFYLPQLSDSRGLTQGPDGNFWLTNAAPRDQLICVTPSTQITAYDLPDFGGQPGAITAFRKSLWFTETSGNLTGEIGRILL
ncbi:MAG TPA: PQQ-binding-like beta-propeller repeat protein [Ktedonobacteraceae bacterium]|jgi:virginiamycin B lyase